jgi:hypothetical protein
MSTSGYELLKAEMERRGLTKAQIESKAVGVVLDIIANNGQTNYLDLNDVLYHKRQAEVGMERAERQAKIIIDNARIEANKYRRDDEKLKTQMDECIKYFKEFKEALENCETPQGRDALRTAQMFINNVDINTVYDNTAFIIGLSAILTQTNIDPIIELKKINPCLKTKNFTFNMETGARRRYV